MARAAGFERSFSAAAMTAMGTSGSRLPVDFERASERTVRVDASSDRVSASIADARTPASASFKALWTSARFWATASPVVRPARTAARTIGLGSETSVARRDAARENER